MLTKLIRLIHTVRYLRLIQIVYQIRYKVFGWRHPRRYHFNLNQLPVLKLIKVISNKTSYRKESSYSFNLLNIEHNFDQKINWNHAGYGKLWVYNLNYFEFLHQERMNVDDGLELIKSFIAEYPDIEDGREPFPTSLRLMNWIKFCIYHNVSDPMIDESIAHQASFLRRNMEVHLLGNHLLENAYSLFMVSYYLNSEELQVYSSSLLLEQLDEQILNDGCHFELSTMYHSLMLYRLLDCINLVHHNMIFNTDISGFLSNYASKMLSWLKNISIGTTSMPMLGDSSPNIAPSLLQLAQYAEGLNIERTELKLDECGYRKIRKGELEVVADVGKLGPDYIPGHGHADALHFELYYCGEPICVDTGISTYEKNTRRNWERGTAAHNTVVVDSKEQSDVWGGFRVGARASCTLNIDEPGKLSATHDGYHGIGVIHERTWLNIHEGIRITDTLIGNRKTKAVARFHLAPNIEPVIKDQGFIVNGVNLTFQNSIEVKIEEYEYSEGFNRLISAKCISVAFSSDLITEFTF